MLPSHATQSPRAYAVGSRGCPGSSRPVGLQCISRDARPRSGMRRAHRLLVIVDGSTASRRAVRYVGMLLGGRRGFRIFLVYPLPSLPPKLLETRGAENPAEEKRLDAGLKAAQRQWIAEAGQAGERALTN